MAGRWNELVFKVPQTQMSLWFYNDITYGYAGVADTRSPPQHFPPLMTPFPAAALTLQLWGKVRMEIYHWGQILSDPTSLSEPISRGCSCCLALDSTPVLHQYCSPDHTATEPGALTAPVL